MGREGRKGREDKKRRGREGRGREGRGRDWPLSEILNTPLTTSMD